MADDLNMRKIRRLQRTAAQALLYTPDPAKEDSAGDEQPITDAGGRLDFFIPDGAGGLRRGSMVESAAGQSGAIIQRGTATLVDGKTAPIAATITATSKIYLTHAGGAGTTRGILASTDRVVGAPGSFTITATDLAGVQSADDDSSVDWLVIN